MLRILYDDFDQKVKNIHDEMDLHHSYIKKACSNFLIRQVFINQVYFGIKNKGRHILTRNEIIVHELSNVDVSHLIITV